MQVAEAHRSRDGVQLLDIRDPCEWVAGHVEGAVHVLMGQLATRQSELAADRPIVVVCRSGNRAQEVTAALRSAGYTAETLDGGMRAWMAAGLPAVSEDGQPPRVA